MKTARAIIELTGDTGAGKTTLATLLGEELSPAEILFIDASFDQKLTQMLCPEPPDLTLGNLFNRRPETAASREAIDWVFSDLAVFAGGDNELMTVGPLEADIEIADREKLRYGLSRLMEQYDYVIVDGWHPLIHQLLPVEKRHTLSVLTPGQMGNWTPPEDLSEGTPSLVLNCYAGEAYSPQLENALLHNQVQLIGKLPRYANAEEVIRKMSDDFRNCLLRLNIPLNLQSS